MVEFGQQKTCTKNIYYKFKYESLRDLYNMTTTILLLLTMPLVLGIIIPQAFAQGFQEIGGGNSSASVPAPQQNQNQDQKLILGDIVIPINPDTTLSLDMPDSRISIQPNNQ